MLRRTAGIGCALLALLLTAACGEDRPTETRIIGDTVSVYSSLPMSGPLAAVSRDVVAAEKLALLDAGGRAGRFAVSYRPLDSADPRTGRWSPSRVEENARVAVDDRQTIAYLGELENGASAVSLPILNESGILQVSPRDTFAGLTGPGGRGEPEKYYPSGRRTFGRVVPADDEQVRTLLGAIREGGRRRLVIADDRRLSGSSMGDRVERLARGTGIEVVSRLRLDARGDVPPDIGRRVAGERADAFLYAGAYSRFALGVLDLVHAADRRLALFAPDDVTIAPELPRQAGGAAARLELVGVEPPDSAATRSFERRFREVYGRRPERQAVLGFEAMRVVLRAIAAAGDRADSRREVIAKALGSLGAPRASFARFRLERDRLVPVG